jgi:hypothetical protein
MFFSLTRQVLAALLVSVVVAACGGGSSAPAPQAGIALAAGDGKVTVTWKMEPGVQYWVFYAPVSARFPAISTTDWINTPGARAVMNVTSPYQVTGLTNGFEYSFTVNARTGDGPGGPGTPPISATPRPAGTVWNKAADAGTQTLRAVTYGLGSDNVGYYLAMGDNGVALKSTTGLTWAAVTSAPATQINSNIYTLARYLAVGNGGAIVSTTDFATWTAATSGTTKNLNSVTSNGVTAVAVGDGGTIVTSTDGTTWTAAIVPTTKNLYSITYAGGNGFWVAVGEGGTLLLSTNGTAWTAKTSGVTADLRTVTAQYFATYTFVALGDQGTAISSVDNGNNWAVQSTGITGSFRSISQTSGQLVGVGTGGLVAASTDGVKWTTRESGTTADLYTVLGGLSQYIALGAGGVNINSQ